MPTYEYQCDACGHRFEKFQSITAAPIKKCPECGKSKVRRLIGTGAGLLFKGSGFYITDYRPDSYNQAAKADSSGSGGGGGGGGESKNGETAKPAAASSESTSSATPAPAKAESKPATAAPKKSSKSSGK
jgi:putative FmdB family regulatory protein